MSSEEHVLTSLTIGGKMFYPHTATFNIEWNVSFKNIIIVLRTILLRIHYEYIIFIHLFLDEYYKPLEVIFI